MEGKYSELEHRVEAIENSIEQRVEAIEQPAPLRAIDNSWM
jgi:hypothetical protein